MKYNKFLRTITKLTYDEMELQNAYHILLCMIGNDTWKDYIPKIAYTDILSTALKQKATINQSLDNIVYNIILHRMLKDSNDDSIIAHIVANCIDNYTIKNDGNWNIDFKINYDINKDDVLNEMLLSSIKGKVLKNDDNYQLFMKYIDEKMPNIYNYYT